MPTHDSSPKDRTTPSTGRSVSSACIHREEPPRMHGQPAGSMSAPSSARSLSRKKRVRFSDTDWEISSSGPSTPDHTTLRPSAALSLSEDSRRASNVSFRARMRRRRKLVRVPRSLDDTTLFTSLHRVAAEDGVLLPTLMGGHTRRHSLQMMPSALPASPLDSSPSLPFTKLEDLGAHRPPSVSPTHSSVADDAQARRAPHKKRMSRWSIVRASLKSLAAAALSPDPEEDAVAPVMPPPAMLERRSVSDLSGRTDSSSESLRASWSSLNREEAVAALALPTTAAQTVGTEETDPAAAESLSLQPRGQTGENAFKGVKGTSPPLMARVSPVPPPSINGPAPKPQLRRFHSDPVVTAPRSGPPQLAATGSRTRYNHVRRFQQLAQLSGPVTDTREYEDVSDALNANRNSSHRSLSSLNTLFGVTIDDLSHFQRKKRVNASFEHRRLVVPLIKRRVGRIAEEDENKYKLSLEIVAEGDEPDSPLSRHVWFPPGTPREVIEATVHRSILKHSRDEDWEDAMARVFRERQDQEKRFVAFISRGGWLRAVTTSGSMERVFVLVSKDGSEIAWGKNQTRVRNAIAHKRTFFPLKALFAPAAKLKLLPDVTRMGYGSQSRVMFNKYLRTTQGQPWHCFTITWGSAQDDTVGFICDNEEEVPQWFLGIQSLIPMNHDYITAGRFLWQRARMKLIERARLEQTYPGELIRRMVERAVHKESQNRRASTGSIGLRSDPAAALLRRNHEEKLRLMKSSQQ